MTRARGRQQKSNTSHRDDGGSFKALSSEPQGPRGGGGGDGPREKRDMKREEEGKWRGEWNGRYCIDQKKVNFAKVAR